MPSILFQGAFLRYNLIMSYKYSVIKDNPLGFWFLDEQSGTSAIDISGCGNNGVYLQSVSNPPLPLTYGGVSSVEITNSQSITFPLTYNYYGISKETPIANKNYSYNPFTIECFIYPKNLTSTMEPVVADSSNGIGLFASNNGVSFALNGLSNTDSAVYFAIPNFNRVVHVVCNYSVSEISIYIDGEKQAAKALNNFVFTNSFLSLKCGPTSVSSNKFLVDSVAIYRYSLSESQIQNHYNLAQAIPAFNITYPDLGELFDIYDTNISTKFEYSYPARKPWKDMTTAGLEYDFLKNRIQIPVGSGNSQSAFFTEFLYIPSQYGIDSSKIEWSASYGVSVYSSIDGLTYVQCENGSKIPQYGNVTSGESFDPSYGLYIKVVFETVNDSNSNPFMESLTIKFYKEQKLYATNSASYISQITDDPDYFAKAYAGDKKYSALSRNFYGGIRVKEDSGFYLNISRLCTSMEFFYTPKNISVGGLIYREDITFTELLGGLYNTSYTGLDVVDGGLYNSSYTASYDAGPVYPDIGVEYTWGSSGTITKNNIKKIYVNRIDKTSQTSISNVFKAGEIYHVVLVFENQIMNLVKLGYSVDGAAESSYQYISLYDYELDSGLVSDHYQIHINGDPVIISENAFSLTENAPEVFDNDWLVIQNI